MKIRYEIQKLIKKIGSGSVFKYMVIVISISVITKAIGFYKETLVASTFGLDVLLDSFKIAFIFPALVQSIFIQSLKNVFVPNYVAELSKTDNEKNIGKFQSICALIILGIVLLVTLLSLIFDFFFIEIIFDKYSSETFKLIHKQLYILIPCLFFWGYSSFLAGLLEIDNKFKISSITPIFIAVAIIFNILFLKEKLGIYVLSVGTLTGSFIGTTYLYINAKRFNLIILSKPVMGINSRIMLRQLPAKMTSSFLTGMNGFIDQFFAGQLLFGSISAIDYGVKVPRFILGFSMIAIGTVLLPHFSKQLSKNKKKAFAELYKICKIVFVIGMIIITFLYFFSYDIVKILFEKNNFTSKNTYVVSNIQQIIFLYVPLYLCGNIFVKFLTSMNKNSFLAYMAAFNLFLNIMLNILLVRYYGIYGLAMSTTIVISLSSIIYGLYVLKLYKKLN